MKLGTAEIRTPLGVHRRTMAITGTGAATRLVDLTAARIAFLERTLPAVTARRVGEAQLPPDLVAIIAGGKPVMQWVREAVDAAAGVLATSDGQAVAYQGGEATLIAPIPRPPGIACFTTWPDHIKEAEKRGSSVRWIDEGSDMRLYYKGNPDSVIGSGVPLETPSYGDELDMELEFAAIVGTGGRDLTVEQAREAIAGYCIYNDVSIRYVQRREMSKGLGPAKGKDHDGGNVLGPWLVTPDEVGDVKNLTMSLHVDGQQVSDYNTSRMCWDHAELLAYLSRGQTIAPGHVLTSGSYPGGCGLDLKRRFKPGEEIEMRISHIGAIRNRIAEPDASKRKLIELGTPGVGRPREGA